MVGGAAGTAEGGEGGAGASEGGGGEADAPGTAGAEPIEAKVNKRHKNLSNTSIKPPKCSIKTYLPGMSLPLQPEVLELQKEGRDFLAKEQEVMVLQPAEDRVQRM